MDEIDLLREQHKILSGEVALYMSALKRLSEEAAQNPKDEHLHVTFFKLYFSHSKFSLGIHPEVKLCTFSMQAEIINLKEDIHQKNNQIASLQKQIDESIMPPGEKVNLEESQVF